MLRRLPMTSPSFYPKQLCTVEDCFDEAVVVWVSKNALEQNGYNTVHRWPRCLRHPCTKARYVSFPFPEPVWEWR